MPETALTSNALPNVTSSVLAETHPVTATVVATQTTATPSGRRLAHGAADVVD